MHRNFLAASLRHPAARITAALAAAAAMSACGSGGGASSGSAAPAPAGSLRLALTDAPGCGFDHVFVTLDRIRMHQSSTALDTDPGWTDIPVAPGRRIDLLALTNGALQEIGTTPLPPGHYAQMRLVLAADAGANTVQPTGGAELPLAAADGSGGSLRIPVGFDIAAAQNADLVLDVDACKSVVQAGSAGTYQFKPVGAVFPRSASAVQGAVAATLAPASTTVSVQQAGATVRATRPDDAGKFSIPFLQPGTYNLVIHSEGRATGVVTGVPVGNGTTTVSTPATAIALAASPMAEITGTATGSTPSDAGTMQSAVLADGEVRASRSLTGGESIEVRSAQLDPVLGTYRLSVPKAAPMKAPYDPSGVLSFAPDLADGGGYGIDLVIRDDGTAAN